MIHYLSFEKRKSENRSRKLPRSKRTDNNVKISKDPELIRRSKISLLITSPHPPHKLKNYGSGRDRLFRGRFESGKLIRAHAIG